MEASYDEILAAINASKELFPVLGEGAPPNLQPEPPLEDIKPVPPPEEVPPEEVPPDVAEPPKEGGTSAFGVTVLNS